MRNEIIEEGNLIKIIVQKKNGKIFHVLIDKEDFERVNNYFSTIYINTHGYVCGNGKNPEYLHRFIMNCPKNKQVDHIEHNTLDNRKQKLRIVNNSKNSRNRKGAQSNNKSSGIRGVTWNKNASKWQVVVYKKYLGLFDNLDKASEVAKDAIKRGIK